MKWTNELRKIVFSRLVMEFGPYSGWELSQRPEQDRTRYDAALQQLASYLEAITNEKCEPTAVSAQVHWGCTTQKSVKDEGCARNFVLNKAAALEAGFIATGELPKQLDIQHSE